MTADSHHFTVVKHTGLVEIREGRTASRVADNQIKIKSEKLKIENEKAVIGANSGGRFDDSATRFCLFFVPNFTNICSHLLFFRKFVAEIK